MGNGLPRQAVSGRLRNGWGAVLLPASIAAGVLVGPLLAAPPRPDGPPDQRAYHLFQPVPREFLRELSADRPDQTESPFTVDAGWFQVEMDFVNFTSDRSTAGGTDTRLQAWNAAPLNLKMGLLHFADFQLVLDNYVHTRSEDRRTGTVETRSGFGNVTTRLKLNFWGNDGGTAALGMMPFVRWPTAAAGLGSRHVEGGVLFPLALALPRGWDLGFTTGVDFLRQDPRPSYVTLFINSIAVGHSIVGPLSGYVEFYTEASTDRQADWIGTVDVGFTYGLTPDVQLDAGVNVGVTPAADDINPFAGLTFRF